jgi:NlpC/P60 family protein
MGPRSTLAFASWVVAVAMFSGACAKAGGTPRPFPTPADRRPAEHSATEGRIGRVDPYALVGTALNLRGTPYKDGGADATGFDCSGFTRYVFARHGVSLPRAVREQYRVGHSVPAEKIVPGDLVFFTTNAAGASHVGIAVGGHAFVHAPSSRGVVRVEDFNSRFWQRRLVGVRRVIAAD